MDCGGKRLDASERSGDGSATPLSGGRKIYEFRKARARAKAVEGHRTPRRSRAVRRRKHFAKRLGVRQSSGAFCGARANGGGWFQKGHRFIETALAGDKL